MLGLWERHPSSATNGYAATVSFPSVGVVVLLIDTLSRGRWKLAVIQNLLISLDGEVPSAVVRTSTDMPFPTLEQAHATRATLHASGRQTCIIHQASASAGAACKSQTTKISR